MELIFAGRRRKLLALKALRDGQRHGTPHGAEQSVCPHCSGACTGRELADALYVCPRCGYHYPVGAYYRLSTILDSGSFRELNEKLGATDPLCFPGYREKLAETQRRTGLTEAVVTASGAIGGQKVIAAVLDSRFLMGSMVAFAAGLTAVLRQLGIVPAVAAGLSLGEYSALHAAGVWDAQTAIRTAAFRGQAMRISPPNAAYKVNSLIKKGYVNKVRSPEDHREYHLEITQKYMDYYNISTVYMSEVMDRIAQRFSPEDCAKLEEMLSVVSRELMPEVELPQKSCDSLTLQ